MSTNPLKEKEKKGEGKPYMLRETILLCAIREEVIKISVNVRKYLVTHYTIRRWWTDSNTIFKSYGVTVSFCPRGCNRGGYCKPHITLSNL